MITTDNFKRVLQKLGFIEKNDVFYKKFADLNCELKADFNEKKLIYPENRGLTVNERQTCNFKQPENFVVFECVYKLLSQGYHPKHIELEPKWQVGHGASGGRADYVEKSNTLNFRQANIRPNGVLDLEHKKTYLPDSFNLKYKQYLLKDDDVVIAMTDMNRELNLLAIPTVIKTNGYNLLLNQRVGKFFNYNLKKLIPSYLNEVLKSSVIRQVLQRLGYGNVQANLSRGDLLNIKIPLPPLDIQEKIVAKCQKVDDAVQKAKEEIEKAKSEIVKVIQTPSSNAKTMKLGEACNMKAGKFVAASSIYAQQKDRMYPCYGGNGFRCYVETFTHEGSYPLIGRQGALCGNVNFVSEKFHATEHAVVVIPKVELNIKWLYYKLVDMNLNQYKNRSGTTWTFC